MMSRISTSAPSASAPVGDVGLPELVGQVGFEAARFRSRGPATVANQKDAPMTVNATGRATGCCCAEVVASTQ